VDCEKEDLGPVQESQIESSDPTLHLRSSQVSQHCICISDGVIIPLKPSSWMLPSLKKGP
jgi:hypothetical protein